MKAAVVLLVGALMAASCSVADHESVVVSPNTPSVEAVDDGQDSLPTTPGAESTAEPAPDGESTAEPAPDGESTAEPPDGESTAEPTPDAESTAEPTPDSAETAESAPDTSGVVIDGGEWSVTENDVERIRDFIELTHQLEFTGPVGVMLSDDIGLEFAAGFEPFSEDEWDLLQALGLAGEVVDRQQANQVRLDRIRGLCCVPGEEPGSLSVVMEIQPTKFATELILMHEFVHALHVQNPELYPRRNYQSIETPLTFSAAVEGVPQYVVFEYLAMASEEDRASVIDDLPIIRDDMLSLLDPGVARHLNWAYDTGADFVDGVVADRGAAGLSELIGSPPLTNEQVMFPDRYLADEAALAVDVPVLTAGSVGTSEGTIGAALLMWVLADQVGEEAARDFVAAWAGDSYVIYQVDDVQCLAATIMVDQGSSEIGTELLAQLRLRFPAADGEVAGGSTITFDTCGNLQ